MKIYPITARIPIKVGDVTFWVAPLTHEGRLELTQFIVRSGGAEYKADLKYCMKCLQLSLKKIEGITWYDDTEYQLRFDDNGIILDECMNEISQFLGSASAAMAASSLLGSMEDPKLPGVEVAFDKMYLEETKKKS